jgi:hypothetical protein
MPEYLQSGLWIIEAMAVAAMFSFTYFLTLKKRWAWLLYLVFCAGMLIVFTEKQAWITVMNQCGTIVLAIRNLIIWDWSEVRRQKALRYDYAIIPWFISSVVIFWPGVVLNAWGEVCMWVFIITKQVSWGRKSRGGWWILIGQHIFATGFNIVSGTFVLLIRPVIEISLAIYGLKKWK